MQPQARSARRREVGDDDRNVEQRAGRCTHGLGVVRVDRSRCEHHGVDTRRLGRPQDRAQVARIGELVGHHDEAEIVEVDGLRRHADHGEVRLRALGRGDTFEHAVGELGHGRARHRFAAGRDELGDDGPPGVDRFGDQDRALRRRRHRHPNASYGAPTGAAALGSSGS
jgi:hypothetical protein